MTLQSSGPIGPHEIGAELGVSAPYNLRTMASSVGMSTPDPIDEFYGFTKRVFTVNSGAVLTFDRFGTPITTGIINVTVNVNTTITIDGTISSAYTVPTTLTPGTHDVEFFCGSINNSGVPRGCNVRFRDTAYNVIYATAVMAQNEV